MQRGGWFRQYVPEKALDGYYIYCVDGHFFEFFAKTPLIEVERKRIKHFDPTLFPIYEFENTGVTLHKELRNGSDVWEGFYPVTAAAFLREVEPFMQDDKAKLAMEKHFADARQKKRQQEAEQAQKAAATRTAEKDASSALEDWISK